MGSARTTQDALARVRTALLVLSGALEGKAGFNPNQPRRPKGTPIGGQWRDAVGGPSNAEMSRYMVDGAERIERFIQKHRRTITRVTGGLQAVAGALEVVAGGAVVTGGAATSEFLVGVPIAGMGAWLVWNGYDNTQAGIYALVTGEPKPTSLHKLLRGIGLSGPDADAVELALGFAGGAGATNIGRAALERAARKELARRALLAFDDSIALSVVTPDGRSLWRVADIGERGKLWEKFDADRAGYWWTPYAKTYDQISPDGMVAISNKTIDLQAATYLRTDRKALLSKVKYYLNKALFGMPKHPFTGQSLPLARRELHLLLRHGDAVPGQALQLAAAEEYAKSIGVRLVVDYAF